MKRSTHLSFLVAALLVPSATALQAPDWANGFVGPSAWLGVTEVATFDDGGGEKLYVCTSDQFQIGNPNIIRRFDGSQWEPFDVQTAGRVLASCVWNDGTGDALYLAGTFSSVAGVPAQRIARFDGTSWTPLGLGIDGTVEALVVHDDGSGPALYAAGAFDHAGGLLAPYVARWNGSSWSSVNTLYGHIHDLCVFDDGTGPALYACGNQLWMGGPADGSIARFDGNAWTFLPDFALSTPEVRAMEVFDDGTGPALYAGHYIAGNIWRVGRWDGATWTTVGADFDAVIEDLHGYTSGGAGLYAMGKFTHLGGATTKLVARWNGAAWSSLPSPLQVGSCNPTATSMCTFDPLGGPPLLVLGGCFYSTDAALTGNLAQWDGSRVTSIGLGQGVSGTIFAQTAFDDGSGEALFVGGSFTRAGANDVTNIGRWNGASFAPMPLPFNGAVQTLALHDDGTGRALYAGGRGVRRWTGSGWVAMDAGLPVNPTVASLCAWNDNGTPALVAGVQEYMGPSRVMRWNGTTWTQVGGDFIGAVGVVGVHDSGAGEELFAGGVFNSAGVALLQRIARWNGSAWAPLGAGVDGAVTALHSFDDGSGPALYVGGLFGNAGLIPAPGIARWRNGTWSAVGAGLGSGAQLQSMCTHDDGSGGGPALHVGGTFSATVANGVARGVARWDGSSWTTLGAGLQSNGAFATSLGSYRAPHQSRAGLHVAGFFSRAGGEIASNFSVFGAEDDGRPICFGDGRQQACPCGNSSAVGAGAGCMHSQGHGSELRARGTASVSADTFGLVGARMPPSSFVLYFQGTYAIGSGVGAPFAGGLRCAGGTVTRLYHTQNSGGASAVPNPAFPTPVSVRGMIPAAGGGTRVYQAWHRDALGMCGQASNLTNGVLVTWHP